MNKLILFILSLLISTTVLAIDQSDSDFCKQQARNDLDFRNNMADIQGNTIGSHAGNSQQIMQNAYDACMQGIAASKQQQQQIDNWQPQQQQPTKKGWFN